MKKNTISLPLVNHCVLSITMFRIVCKSILSFTTTSKPHKFIFQQFSSLASNANKSISNHVNQHSFTVSYLINEFGFSLQKALLASKNLQFKNRKKPDAVVSFLKNQGFTHTQILKVISAHSPILICKPENTLLPKIEFFRSKGVSSTDLAKMIVLNGHLLKRSLKDYIIPTFNSLRDFIGSDESVILMLKADSRLFNYEGNHVKSNIGILRGAGVPYSRIDALLKTRTSLFCYGPDKLKESIEEVDKMGMDPKSYSYSEALAILTTTPRSKLNQKMEAYKRWGCSEDQVHRSFKVQPMIMSLSVEKINAVMTFCVNEMGLEPSEVVRRYYLLILSVNKRIVPRWSVYQELVSKRMVKEDRKWPTLFKLREDLFLEKYVNCYIDTAPLLLKLYLEKLDASN